MRVLQVLILLTAGLSLRGQNSTTEDACLRLRRSILRDLLDCSLDPTIENICSSHPGSVSTSSGVLPGDVECEELEDRGYRAFCEDASWNEMRTCASTEVHQAFLPCNGTRPSQLYPRERRCNGRYDCVDRSDESGCHDGKEPNHISVFDILELGTELPRPESIFEPCEMNHSRRGEVRGAMVDGWCMPPDEVCKGWPAEYQKKEGEYDAALFHPQHVSLCKNLTFWKSEGGEFLKPCPDSGWERCAGNYPGFCTLPELRRKCCDHPRGCASCPDLSAMICLMNSTFCDGVTLSKTEGFNWGNEGNVFRCLDNKKCLHESLVCDGYAQCDDASDELEVMCKDCSRKYGYPWVTGYTQKPRLNSKNAAAVLSCKHRYTGRPICAVPCDERDDLCEGYEDEICQGLAFLEIMVYIGIASAAAILATEAARIAFASVPFFHRDEDLPASDIEDQQESLLGMDITAEEYARLREGKTFGPALLNLIQTATGQSRSVSRADAVCKAWYDRESRQHAETENPTGVIHEFYFRSMGTNSVTMSFFDHVWNSLGVKIKRIILSHSTMITMAGSLSWRRFFALKISALRILLHYSDLIKDLLLISRIYMLGLASARFDSHVGLAATFPNVVFGVVLASIVASELMNLVVMVAHPAFSRWPAYARVLAVVFLPIVPAVVLYMEYLRSHEIAATVHRLDDWLTRPNGKDATDDTKKKLALERRLSRARESLHSLTSLRADFRANENVFEHLVQVAVLLLIKFVESSPTRTVDSLGRIFLERNNEFVVLSAAISVFSIVSGHVFYLKTKKRGFMKPLGIVITSIYFLVGTAIRVFFVVVFFTPTLGTFNVLQHAKMGAILATEKDPQPTYDLWPNGTARPLVNAWDDLRFRHGSADFLHIPLEFIYVAVPVLFATHAAFSLFLHRHLGGRMASALYSLICPPLFNDWEDHRRADRGSVEASWSTASTSYRMMLGLYFAQHLVLSAPLLALKRAVNDRNRRLNEMDFAPLREELDSTASVDTVLAACLVLLVAHPLTMLLLSRLYFRSGHPWSEILKSHAKVFPWDRPTNGGRRSRKLSDADLSDSKKNEFGMETVT